MRLSFVRATAGLAVAVVLFSCSNQTSQLTSTQTLSQVKLVAANGAVQATLVSTAEAEKAAGLQLCYVGSVKEVGQNIGTQQGVPTMLTSSSCASAALNSNAGNYVATVEYPQDVDVGFFAVVEGSSKRVEVLTQLRKNTTSVTRNLMLPGADPYDIDDISANGSLLSWNGSGTAVRAVPTQTSSSQVAQPLPLVPSTLENDDSNYLLNTDGSNQEYATISVYSYGNQPFSVLGCANNTIVNARVAYAGAGEIADAYNTSASNLTLLVNAPDGLSLVQANCSAALSGSGATSSFKQVNKNQYYDGIFSSDLKYAYMMKREDLGLFGLLAVNISSGQETPLAQFTAGNGDAPIALFSLPRRPSQSGVTYAVLQNKAGKDGQVLLRFLGDKLEVFTGAGLAKQTFTAGSKLPLGAGLPESLFQIQGQTESIVAQATRDAGIVTYTYQTGALTPGVSQTVEGRLKYVSLDGKSSYVFSDAKGLFVLEGAGLSPSLWVEQAVVTSAQEVYARNSDGVILRNGSQIANITGATGLTVNATDAYVVNADNLYRVTAGQLAKTWAVGGDAVAVTVSNTGAAVAAVIKGSAMTLVDTSTGATTPVTLTGTGTVSGVASFEDAFAVKQGSTITAVDVKGNQTTVARGVIGVGLGESAEGQTSAIVVTATTVDVYSSANAFTKSKTISLPQNAADALQGESDVKVGVGPNGNISISTSSSDIEVYTDGTAVVSARKKPASTSSSAAAPNTKTTIVKVGQLDVEDGNAYQLQYVAKPSST